MQELPVKEWIEKIRDMNVALFDIEPDTNCIFMKANVFTRENGNWRKMNSTEVAVDQPYRPVVMRLQVTGGPNILLYSQDTPKAHFIEVDWDTLKDAFENMPGDIVDLAQRLGIGANFIEGFEERIGNRKTFVKAMNDILAADDEEVLERLDMSERQVKEKFYGEKEKVGMF